MSSGLGVYYFMIGDFSNHKEIGAYMDNSNENYSFQDYNNVISNCKEIFSQSSEEKIKGKKNSITIPNFKIFFTLLNNGTFYLACVKIGSTPINEDSVFDLFDDVEIQNIKKLVNKNGELTNVGKQNLKFCIDKKISILNGWDNQEDDEESNRLNGGENKITFLNTQINDIQKDVKLSVKNMITNVNDMQLLDTKSAQIKDTSFKFKQDSVYLERKMKCRQYTTRFFFFGILALIIIYTIYTIFK